VFRRILLCLILSYSNFVGAYEISEFVKISQIRPTGGGTVYLHLNAPAICASTVLTIDTTAAGGKEMYSATLTAAAANKYIKFETWGVCAANGGWGTQIGGLYVQFD